VRLEDVRPGSPAEKGGLKPGDILIEFDGKSIRNVQEYSAVLGTAQPNVAVKIVVLRGGKRVELTVTPAPGGG
jgi:serine protease Do